jgi:hypothetical protein
MTAKQIQKLVQLLATAVASETDSEKKQVLADALNAVL